MGNQAGEKIGSRKHIRVQNDHNPTLCLADTVVSSGGDSCRPWFAQHSEGMFFLVSFYDLYRSICRGAVHYDYFCASVRQMHESVTGSGDVLRLVPGRNHN
jgi:hypothetical protein